MDKIRKQYKSICDALKLLEDYESIKSGKSDDLKKTFQFDCVCLLSTLAGEDAKISEREKSFINEILGIEISDMTVSTFSHASSKFNIETVTYTVANLCAVDSETWKKLGTKDDELVCSIIDFYESIGENLLKIDNPKASLEKLYRFIRIQKEYAAGISDAGLPGSAGTLFSNIGRDFFGGQSSGSGAGNASAGFGGKNTDTASTDNSVQTQIANVPKQEEMEDPMAELEKLVGLDDIKRDVKELISLVKVQKLRAGQEMKSVPVSLHLVFTGNPGTGKTTVARILAQLYKQIGVLDGGQLVETDRSGLVAGYVGQTAIKTSEMIKQAMGGVLFIDEAYSLAKEGNDFGQEAIATILKAMEDNRDKFVVIVAGYDDLMENFINSNPGLKSRFNKYFHFPDYNADEMTAMFKINCKKYQYTLAEGTEEIVHGYMQKLIDNKDENFANGRDARNYFEKVITKQACRISELENPEKDDISLITAEDFNCI